MNWFRMSNELFNISCERKAVEGRNGNVWLMRINVNDGETHSNIWENLFFSSTPTSLDFLNIIMNNVYHFCLWIIQGIHSKRLGSTAITERKKLFKNKFTNLLRSTSYLNDSASLVCFKSRNFFNNSIITHGSFELYFE